MDYQQGEVVNLKAPDKPDQVFYIGRGKGERGQWGNPFKITKDRSREQAVMAYERHLLNQLGNKDLGIEDLAAIYGISLGCFCAPLVCHGHVLLLYARRARQYVDNHNVKGWQQFLNERLAYLVSEPPPADYVLRLRRRVRYYDKTL